MLNVVVTATGPLFTLEEAKAHLNVDTAAYDELIETYSNAAVARCLQYCNLSLVPDGDLPESAFKAAALLVLSDLYTNRDATITGTIVSANPAVRALIDPYRLLRV